MAARAIDMNSWRENKVQRRAFKIGFQKQILNNKRGREVSNFDLKKCLQPLNAQLQVYSDEKGSKNSQKGDTKWLVV